MAENQVDVPQWLDRAFIENALRVGMKNPTLMIVQHQLALATAAGDNYASLMLRASSIIKEQEGGKEENLSFIIKLTPRSQPADFYMSDSAFKKEGKMFSEILPELNVLLQKAYPDDESITALGYGYETAPEPVLFFEDLKVSGFEKGDRFHRTDWPQIRLVLKSLAKYHASSYVHIQDKPDVIEFYKESVWDRNNSGFVDNMLKNAFEGLASLVETWEESPEKERYWNKLKNLIENGMEKTQECYARDDNVLNVLLHGDCWMNNYMFRFDESRKVTAVKLVDLQIVNYNTPVLDIIHFIFSSTSPNVWLGDPDLFLSYYHECFVKTLKNLDFNLKESFTLDDLRNEYFKRLFYGVTILYFIYPMTLLSQNDVPGLDDLMREGGGNYMYKNAAVADMLRKAMPFFEKHGVL